MLRTENSVCELRERKRLYDIWKRRQTIQEDCKDVMKLLMKRIVSLNLIWTLLCRWSAKRQGSVVEPAVLTVGLNDLEGHFHNLNNSMNLWFHCSWGWRMLTCVRFGFILFMFFTWTYLKKLQLMLLWGTAHFHCTLPLLCCHCRNLLLLWEPNCSVLLPPSRHWQMSH